MSSICCVVIIKVGAPGKDTDEVVASLKLHEAYDILEAMKRIVDEDNGERARSILESHPQLVIALLQIQVNLSLFVISD